MVRSINERTHIEDLLSYEWAPTKRPIKGVDRPIPRDEVVGPDIGVFRERIEASAYKHERRGVVDFVENDLQDLIYSGLSATHGLWGYGGDTPARRSISSQIGLD